MCGYRSESGTVLLPDLRVDQQGLVDVVPQTGLHGPLHVPQPVLHVPAGLHRLQQLHLLALTGVHVGDLQVCLELQLGAEQGGCHWTSITTTTTTKSNPNQNNAEHRA